MELAGTLTLLPDDCASAHAWVLQPGQEGDNIVQTKLGNKTCAVLHLRMKKGLVKIFTLSRPDGKACCDMTGVYIELVFSDLRKRGGVDQLWPSLSGRRALPVLEMQVNLFKVFFM